MTLDRRLSKLEASISLEARPGTGRSLWFVVIWGGSGCRGHLAAHPEDQGAKVVIFIFARCWRR